MSGRRRMTRGRRRTAIALGAALALTGGSWAGLQVFQTGEAEALTAPVAMAADDLPTWQTNGVVWAMAEANGVVFAGGTFSAVRPPGAAAGSNETKALNFAAFDAATGAPTDCKLDFTVGTGVATVRALDVSPDGKTLYAAGSFGAVNGTGVNRLVAIDIASCTVKTSFRPTVSATVRALEVTEETVYIGGDFKTVKDTPRGRFAALSTSGALLPWNPDADLAGRAIEALPGGKVAIGGDFNTVGGQSSHALAVVDGSSGAVSKAFGTSIESRSVVKDITSDSAGLYTGNEGTGGGAFDGRLALNLSDLGERWRDTCLGATQAVLVYKSALYSSSHAHNCSKTPGGFPELGARQHLLAQSLEDSTLLGWTPNTDSGPSGTEQIGPRVMVTSTSGGKDYMWVGGEFTRIASNGNKLQQGLTRFASDPDTGKPTAPTANTPTASDSQVELTWQAGVDMDDKELFYRIYRDGGSTPVATVTGESAPWNLPTYRWTDTGVGAGGTFTYRIAAEDAAGNVSALSAPVTVTVEASDGENAGEPRPNPKEFSNFGKVSQ